MALRWFDKRRDPLLEGIMAGYRDLEERADFPTGKPVTRSGGKSFQPFPSLFFRGDCSRGGHIFASKLFSRSLIHNLFPQLGYFISWQGSLPLRFQMASMGLAHDQYGLPLPGN
jgi:hypothetical protein